MLSTLRESILSVNYFLSSSIGRKIVMAITGLALGGFIFFHMIGNLQIFIGQDALNSYAELLHAVPTFLWLFRTAMIICLILHIINAVQLRLINGRARPDSYSVNTTVEATVASRYMLETGIIVFIFIVFHLLHYTFRMIKPEFSNLLDPQGRPDVYSMLVAGFQYTPFALLYILALIVLGIHLWHAIQSFFQTLGISHPTYTPWINLGSLLITIVIIVGYLVVPVSVMLGIVTLPEGVISV